MYRTVVLSSGLLLACGQEDLGTTPNEALPIQLEVITQSALGTGAEQADAALVDVDLEEDAQKEDVTWDFDVEVLDVWSEMSSYSGVGTWIDAHATIVNHGPEPAWVHVDLDMISENPGSEGTSEWWNDEGWLELEVGESVELLSGVKIDSEWPSTCRWRYTLTPEWGQVDPDLDNDSASSETFEVNP